MSEEAQIAVLEERLSNYMAGVNARVDDILRMLSEHRQAGKEADERIEGKLEDLIKQVTTQNGNVASLTRWRQSMETQMGEHLSASSVRDDRIGSLEYQIQHEHTLADAKASVWKLQGKVVTKLIDILVSGGTMGAIIVFLKSIGVI